MNRLGGAEGLPVSAFCLGALPFGTTVDEPTAFEILDRFVEAGGTFIDTADNYACWEEGATGHESEQVLGRWLADRKLRDQVVLATKVGARPCGTGREGLAARTVRSGIEGSLRRLGTDHVDLYYAHIADPGTPQEETVAAFSALVTEGRTRMLGCSNHSVGELRRARTLAADEGLAPYRVIQQRHSYLRPRADADFGVQKYVTDDLLAYVADQPDLSLLGYSTLLSGAYTRANRPFQEQYDRPDKARRLGALREIAAELGATPNQVVLSWLLHGEPPVLPVLGVSSVGQLEECLAAADLDLGPELRKRLDL
ncbi:aldo/keto reductase [Actinomadura sp. DC4]|uniref:aldo/keto reductase n=1 Tax=Actinomadura sp. DC4 TaxID=3055069 RepID=UPI0025B1CF42|nr:aldo/keto reductase [Actinomadura sp. DC4]MDN3353152.1 aldo/keto reductase [Actinomadura sp. DC4]